MPCNGRFSFLLCMYVLHWGYMYVLHWGYLLYASARVGISWSTRNQCEERERRERERERSICLSVLSSTVFDRRLCCVWGGVPFMNIGHLHVLFVSLFCCFSFLCVLYVHLIMFLRVLVRGHQHRQNVRRSCSLRPYH